MNFSLVDHFLFGIGSLFLTIIPFSFFLLLIFLIPKKTKKVKISLFFLFISMYLLSVLWVIYLNQKVCKDFLLLEQDSCQIHIEPSKESNDLFSIIRLFIEVKRENKNKENGVFLGKKGTVFDTKKESFYIEIPLNLKLKDNYSILLLENEQEIIKSKVNSFLKYEDLK